MFRRATLLLFLISLPVGLASCSAGQNSPTAAANLPNPASVYCEQNGGKLEMRENAAGTAGICKFPDGSECEEWAYYRGECRPGAAAPASEASATPAPSRSATAAGAEAEADGWKIYRDQQLGYSFHYPADATISTADDPQHTLTITGGKIEDDYWPNIYFSHPADREEYRPPAGVDLEKWLVEHNLLMTGGKLGEVRQPDTEIAGTRALHTRLARSPQTFAYDKYYFAHSQQLYSVVILHVGDKEDWNVYNHFLASIQFTR